MLRLLKNLLLLVLIITILQIIVSLHWKFEKDLSTGKIQALSIGIPTAYSPEPQIAAIQKYQVEHPELGFIWKSSLSENDNVVVGWGDVPAGTLTTDDIGFANSEKATIAAREGNGVDIIGIGASYMGGAQGVFGEFFEVNGYTYHNLAHGRYTLPQFNIALKKYGLGFKPKWVIYEMNEVSYTLIPDFESWQKSNVDWFEYHSGDWCGPTIKTGFPHNYLQKFPRLYNIYQSFMKKTFRGALNKKPSKKQLIDKSEMYITEAWETCKANNIQFVTLFIPSKVRMVQGPLPSLYLFEELIPRLETKGIPYIDLRKDYSTVENPSLLYFQQDAHWNTTGIYRAARQVLDFIDLKRIK